MEQLKAKRIYLVGMMGSGKSHWSTRLGRSLGFPAFDLDKLIEAKEDKTVREIFDEKGEAYFRTLESETLKDAVPAAEFILACGGGTPCFFDNLAFMKANGLVIWFNPSVEELLLRIKKSPGTRPKLNAAKTDAEIVFYLQDLLAKRRSCYEQADIVINEDYIEQDQLEKIIAPYLG